MLESASSQPDAAQLNTSIAHKATACLISTDCDHNTVLGKAIPTGNIVRLFGSCLLVQMASVYSYPNNITPR